MHSLLARTLLPALLVLNALITALCLLVVVLKFKWLEYYDYYYVEVRWYIMMGVNVLLVIRTAWTLHLGALVAYIPISLFQFILTIPYGGWRTILLAFAALAISGLSLIWHILKIEQYAFGQFKVEIQRFLWALNLTIIFLDFDVFLAALTMLSFIIRSNTLHSSEQLEVAISVLYALMTANNILARAAVRFQSVWAAQISINGTYAVLALTIWTYSMLEPKFDGEDPDYFLIGNSLEFILVIQVISRLLANGHLYFASRSFGLGYKKSVILYHQLCAHPLLRFLVAKRSRVFIDNRDTAELENGGCSCSESIKTRDDGVQR